MASNPFRWAYYPTRYRIRDGVPRFQSAVDYWLALVLAGTPIAIVVACLAERTYWPILLAPFTLIVVVPTRYELRADLLYIRCGFIVFPKIRYDEIVEVVSTRNPLSSPALSLDRLAIRTTSGGVMISPAPRQEFLQELAARAPHAQIKA